MVRSALILGFLALACAIALSLVGQLGDYPVDAGPAVAALAAGNFRRAAAVPFLMGPFSIILRAPFAWVASSIETSSLGAYRAGIFPCVAATSALGVELARRSMRLDRTQSWPLVIPVLAVVSPASVAAVREGHPEEALAGALSVAAVMLATRGRLGWSAISLGLAVATKQWALLAVVPTLLAASSHALKEVIKLGVVAALTAALFYAPFVVADSHAFFTATRIEARVIPAATPETIWLEASHPKPLRFKQFPVLTSHPVAKWIPPASHALIVLIAVPFGLLLWRRGISTADVFAFLALLFLLRCVLDPDDQGYFHLPLVLALLTWEVERRLLVRQLPVATLLVALCLWLTFDVLHPHFAETHIWRVNAFYLAWTSALALYLLSALKLIPLRARRGPELAS